MSGYTQEQARKAAKDRARREREAREAAEAQRQAEAEEARAKGDHEVAEIIEQMPVPVIVEDAVDETKVDGVSHRVTWSAEIVDKHLFVQHVLENWGAFNHLVEPAMPELNKLARAQKENFNIPGAKAKGSTKTVVRG